MLVLFDGHTVTKPEETGMSIITTTNGTWIPASWTPGDERAMYIAGEYLATVVREDNGDYGIAYRVEITIGDYEHATELCGSAEDARDWAEMVIEDARA